jgi:DNA-directed RNA polymerase specialized sigma24 family protein
VPQRNEFEDFYQASYGRVVALLLAVLGNRQEAEDAAQEAFTRALARWPRLSTYEVPEAWVRQVALRLAVDSGRRFHRATRLLARLTGARPVPGDKRDPVHPGQPALELLHRPEPRRLVMASAPQGSNGPGVRRPGRADCGCAEPAACWGWWRSSCRPR